MKIISKFNVLIGISIAIMLFFVLFDLFHPGLPLTHDGKDHVARIANFYLNLQDGNLIPRWAPHLNWGYGHPILMFLYPLPSYIASFFHFIGFSFVDSVKIVFGISYIASGFAMYLWIKNIYGKEAGIISGIVYLFAPYRFIDLYVRGALGEHVAFVFVPLICYFLLKTVKTNKSVYLVGGSIATAALLLSHNAMSLIFMPFVFAYIYFLYITGNRKWNSFIKNLLVIIFGFGLAGFFWIPAFFEGKYTLRDIVTRGGEYAFHFRSIADFFNFHWTYQGSPLFNASVGVVQWLIVLLGTILILFYRHKKSIQWWTLIISVVIFFISLLLITDYSNLIWKNISILQKFQFPWRFLSLTVFVVSIIAGVCVVYISPKWRNIFIILILSGILLTQYTYWNANDYLVNTESYYTNIYEGTTDTGESAPIWSVRFMEKRPVNNIDILDGKATIITNNRSSTSHSYIIDAESDTRLRENTLYFPGWKVYIDKKEVPIEFQDQKNHGVITFNISPGKHDVLVIFKETKLRIMANSISLLTVTLMIIYIRVFNKQPYKNKTKK